MANINDIHSIIVSADAPNFSAHTYNEVFGGSAGCTMVLNGTTVSVGATSNFKIWVRTISGGTGCYLLGDNQNVFQGSNILANLAKNCNIYYKTKQHEKTK